MPNISNVRLAFSKSKDCFILSFSYQDFGVQHFSFDGNSFLEAYNQDKQNVASCLKQVYPKMNQVVESIFNSYLISPTILKRCFNHKGKFSIPLSKKVNIKKPRGRAVKKPKDNFSMENLSPKELKQFKEDEELFISNMELSIIKAAKEHSLMFFNVYLQNKVDLDILYHIKPKYYRPTQKYENEQFKIFKKKVELIQKA